VVDAYGFCGQSVLTEFASTSGRDHVKRYNLRNKERFKIARDLAYGLADIQALRPLNHALPGDGQKIVTNNSPPVFAHNDINIANTVMINGKLKWNDFNIGELLRRQRPNFDASISPAVQGAESNNSTTKNLTTFFPFTVDNSSRINDTICPVPVKFRSDLWRSPEEIRNQSYVRLDLSDMYGFGNLLYQTMTRHQPWTHKEPNGKLEMEDVGEVKLQGAIPTVPEQYRNATQREVQIMFVATLSCYATDPNKRPTATRLARGLGILYDRLKNKTRISRADILDQILPYRIA
jgi:serine/threonine protein kinase